MKRGVHRTVGVLVDQVMGRLGRGPKAGALLYLDSRTKRLRFATSAGDLPLLSEKRAALQVVTGNVTLTTQPDQIQVTAAATITLPLHASWQMGVPTVVTWRTATPIGVVLSANAADKIEGTLQVAGYGYDVSLILTPIAANRWTCEVVRGDLMIPTVVCDLTTAAGAGPTWTIANSQGGTSPVFTDISSAAPSGVAVSSGLVLTAASASGYWSASTATAGAVRTPFSGLVDAWGRPLTASDSFWILYKSSKTTTVGGSTPTMCVSVSSSSISSVPRLGALVTGGATFDAKQRDSATRTEATTVSAVTTAMWMGIWYDGSSAPQLVDNLYNVAVAGNPGVTWWPTSYQIGEICGVGQNFWGVLTVKSTYTNVVMAMSNGTTGSKYTITSFVVIRHLRR